MIVRCGACHRQFDVPGGGRFACPACGSVNIVRGPGNAAGAAGAYPGEAPPPPPPPVAAPSPKVSCSECGFSFIVGKVAMAKCPNCGADVETGYGDPEE